MIALFFLIVQVPPSSWSATTRLLGVINPSWLLAAGWPPMGVGAFLLSRLDVTNTSFGPFVVPALFVGLRFALALNSMTAVALNNVPMHLVGMGSATINMIRDLGFALGPAIVGSVARSIAALATFGQNLAGADLSPQDQGVAEAINKIAGPLAVGADCPREPPAPAPWALPCRPSVTGSPVALWSPPRQPSWQPSSRWCRRPAPVAGTPARGPVRPAAPGRRRRTGRRAARPPSTRTSPASRRSPAP